MCERGAGVGATHPTSAENGRRTEALLAIGRVMELTATFFRHGTRATVHWAGHGFQDVLRV
jgi:hypothetical protein